MMAGPAERPRRRPAASASSRPNDRSARARCRLADCVDGGKPSVRSLIAAGGASARASDEDEDSQTIAMHV